MTKPLDDRILDLTPVGPGRTVEDAMTDQDTPRTDAVAMTVKKAKSLRRRRERDRKWCRASKMSTARVPGEPRFRYRCCLERGHAGPHTLRFGPGQWTAQGWIRRPRGDE